jgi:hypothetical protein
MPLDPSTVAEKAKELVGNWKKFDSFIPDFRGIDDPDNWYIVHTSSRDSNLRAQSNAFVIGKEMKRHVSHKTAVHFHATHWASGYVDGYMIRVFTKKGKPTKAFETMLELMFFLENHALLDDADYSERYCEESVKNIEYIARRIVKEDAPGDWAHKVYRWLSDHSEEALESEDDTGAWPSEDDCLEALNALGLNKTEEDE